MSIASSDRLARRGRWACGKEQRVGGRSRWFCRRPEAAPRSPPRRSTSEGDADPTRRSLRLTRATHGAPSIACTSARRTRTTSGASPPASSRSPARPSSPRSAGRPPPLTDTTPTTAPATLPGRARATGRPRTVAEGSRDLLWAAGSGRPRPFLDGEPRRTPGLEVKPSNISLTPRSRLDLPPVPPRQRPGNAAHHATIPRRTPAQTHLHISRGGAAASLRRHLHGSVRSPRAPQARRSTRTSTASRWRLRRSCTCAAARCSPDPGAPPAACARADGGPRGGWRTGLVDPRAGRPRQRVRLPQRAVAHASVLRAGTYATTQHAVVGLTTSAALDHATQRVRVNAVATR